DHPCCWEIATSNAVEKKRQKYSYKIFGWLIPQKYMGIESIKVARAMLAEAKSNKPGLQVLESAVLQKY
ncbi:MAG: hypothetical protein UZ12_BCD005001867, partial [Bacteroidetes bacterium OLB12]